MKEFKFMLLLAIVVMSAIITTSEIANQLTSGNTDVFHLIAALIYLAAFIYLTYKEIKTHKNY